MIDQIIPETDTPGAKAARVNEFIDVILTEWANDPRAPRFSRRSRGSGQAKHCPVRQEFFCRFF
jgi:hypothetical protein